MSLPRGFSPLLLSLAILAGGCNAGRDAKAPPATMIDVTTRPAVILPDGARILVEVAVDDVTRARGLMFRDRIEPDRGMLFVFESMEIHSFWMKNTLIPLDMVWIDGERRIVDIKAGVPPCKADPCPNYTPNAEALYVLELADGVAAAHGLETGGALQFENLDAMIGR